MFIHRIPNRGSAPAILLRENHREGKKTITRTLANLTHWAPERIAALETALKGGEVSLGGDFELGPGLAHGSVHAVLGTMERLGFRALLSSRACPEQNLVMAMVASRILDPGSKLHLAHTLDPRTATNTLGEELGVAGRPVEEIYAAMDWLAQRQSRIERKLARLGTQAELGV